ncbi:uncharacterized protein ARB_03224 [Trichophyton benhamiae CBS 112371]|uniref:GDP/GTP exchange factor Sec2 N-terminal domain-containing protein n=1 Tax=Arthroderma benhamiae (strain ATCC MYA-4681 / CBS 112371) TaxID=663331 RepID=D4B435_ARTBC|nr:uncharacterized protein ARB_03224 [Trichophyton benhamiae CBS 112371]EFE29883.1 conserved hypothetical protein [Trichophyton benhamiae CBS 112371]
MSTAAVPPTHIRPPYSLDAAAAGAGGFSDAQGLSNTGCPRCGFEGAYIQLQERNIAQQRRIEELEAQTRLLTEKAALSGMLTASHRVYNATRKADHPNLLLLAEKLADYEDGMSSQSQSSQSKPVSAPELRNLDQHPPQQQQSHSPLRQQTRLATLASYFPYGRRTSSNASATQSRQSVSSSQLPQSPSSSSPPSTRAGKNGEHSAMNPLNNGLPQPTSFLQGALNREQALRREAESRLTQANTELEELSAELFMRANEMVANERRERAKLEERVQVLEKRDKEKRTRLERLEKAVERVERVKGLIGNP